MNLISLIICLVLSGLMLSVGIFYNGSSYTASKAEAKYLKITNDMSELSQAVQAAQAQKYRFNGYGSTARSLVRGGFLSSAPHFDKKTDINSAYNYTFYKNTEYMASKSNSDWTIIRILINDKDLCSRVNGFGKIPSLLNNGEMDGGQPSGAIADHIYASGESLMSFMYRPDLIADTICFRPMDSEMPDEYVVSHIIDVSEARRQLNFEINAMSEAVEPN